MCKRCHRSRIQPLSHRWFLIKDIKALVCPFAVHRSRFGLRYSRVRGRRQSKFLASSSTGGARNFYPCTGEPRFALRKATVMRTKILSVTPINPLGVTAPLMNKGSRENGVNAMPCRRYSPSVFSAFIVRGRQVCGRGTPGCPMAACRIRKGCRRLCRRQAHAGTLRRRRRRFR